MFKRWCVAVVGVLAGLCASGCDDKASEPSANATPGATTSAATAGPTFVAATYCRLYARLEKQTDGDPYDPQGYAAAIQTMQRAAESGPPTLVDEWSTLIDAFQAIEAAAEEADLAGLSEITLYEVNRAMAGQGAWPAGVDRQAVEEFDRAARAAVRDESVGEADDAISEHAGQACAGGE